MRLIDCFEEPASTQAFDAYLSKFGRRWPLDSKTDVYAIAKIARCCNQDTDARKKAIDSLYSAVWYDWGAGENAQGSHWSAPNLLSFMDGAESTLAFEAVSEPARLEAGEFQATVRATLTQLRHVKENASGYPWVAVSKFLHVANPALFPIYDITHVWNRAISVEGRHNAKFRRDFADFCDLIGAVANDYSGEFNLTYARFAAHYIARAPGCFMTRFGKWFTGHVSQGGERADVLSDIGRYYTTAFEIILLGATYMNS